MTSIPLFDHDIAAPFSGLSPTTKACSKAAAVKAQSKVERDRARILFWIARHGVTGMTDKELQTLLGMSGNTERPRRIELWKARKIRPEGKRDRHTVWIAT